MRIARLPTVPIQTAPVTDGSRVSLLVHRQAQSRGWLVWAHGGSWRAGSATEWAPITARLAELSRWNVVSVEYRLAPAHRFPLAILDVLAGVSWAEEQVDDGVPVVVGGDSAGGTLAALASLFRRDTGAPVPAQMLAYPPLDPDCTSGSYTADPVAFPNRAALASSAVSSRPMPASKGPLS